MPISDRYEMVCSQKMFIGVIFGVAYLILATKTNMLGKQLFFGLMCGRFGALMVAPMIRNGRYAYPR